MTEAAPLKVLILRTIRGLEAPTGAEINLANLARGLIRHGIAPHFLVSVDPARDHDRCLAVLRDSGAPVETCAVPGATSRADLVAARAAVARLRPDIVHTIDHRADMIGARLRMEGQRPVVATFHGWTNWSRGSLRWRVYGLLDRMALATLDRVIFDCHEMVTSLGRLARAPHLRHVPNGIDTGDFAPARRQLCAGPGITFLQIARFHPNKGQMDMVRAAEKLRHQRDDLRFVLVGDAAPEFAGYEAEVRAYVAEKGLSSVEFTGAIDHADLRAVIAQSDVLVAPSRLDGVSLAVLEAMSTGRAVICYAAEGFAESFRHDETALILDPGDADTLAGAMLALARDPVRAQRLGRAARAHVDACHSSEAMVRRVAGIYREALAAAPANRAASAAARTSA